MTFQRPCPIIPLVAALWALSAAGAPAVALGDTQASDETPSPRRAIDLARYYPSRAAAEAELDAVKGEVETLPASVSADGIGAYLDRTNVLLGRVRRLGAYFVVLAARNIDDRAASASSNGVDALTDAITLKIEKALSSLPPDIVAARLRDDPQHLRYQYLVDEAADRARHQPSPEASRVLEEIGLPTLTAYWNLYQRIDRLALGNPPQPSQAAVNSADRSTREAAWRDRWKIAAAKADANAVLLLNIVRQGNAIAETRGYADAVAAGYASRQLDPSTVRESLTAIKSNLGLYQEYQRLRAERIRKIAGIDAPGPWDLALLRAGDANRFSLDSARRVVLAAFAPLGPDYVRHFSELLAPAAGRIDVAAQVGKRESGGFSLNAPGVRSGLYVASYEGTLNDVRIVAHEGGHAVAAQYANEGNTPSVFTHGPSWLAESYALFNEMLLYDYLASNSHSADDRTYYRNVLLDDMMFQVFGSAQEAILEQSIYESVSQGHVQSAADLNALSFGVIKEFEPWDDDALQASSLVWSTKRLLYQDPFYLINYMYAGMIAVSLYKEAKQHPDTFPKRYTALLKRGYDGDPLTLLAPILGEQSQALLAQHALATMRSELDFASAAR